MLMKDIRILPKKKKQKQEYGLNDIKTSQKMKNKS